MNRALWILLAVFTSAMIYFYARTRGEVGGNEQAGWFHHPEEHRVTSEMLSRTERLVSQSAREFRGRTSDGREISLSELVKQRPLLLLFIKEDCPCSVESQPYFNRLFKAYGDSVTFLGVIDGSEAVAREWARRRNAEFPLLCDPDLKVVREYQAENSVYVALVAPGGRVEAYWPGFSSGMLDDLGARLARLAGVPEKPIDTAGAPAQMASGCPYPVE